MPITIIPDTGVNTIYVNQNTGSNIILSGISEQNSINISGAGGALTPHNSLNGLQGGELGQYYHLTATQLANLVVDSGQYYPSSNPSGYITGIDLSVYVTGDVVRPEDTGIFYTIDNPSGYITGIDLSSYATIDFTTGISGELGARVSVLENSAGDYYLNTNPSGYITGVDLSGYVTGDVVRPNETGQFYPTSNPSGYITGINQVSFLTLLNTGIEETGVLFPYSFSQVPRVFAELALISDTGYLVGVKNVTITGYTAVFSDVIEETGIYLQTLATL